MAHRKIEDQQGQEWDVWEVIPSTIDRRIHDSLEKGGRRQKQGTGVAEVVPEDLRKGWLAFQSRSEKRRLVSYPEDWASLTDADLLGLKEHAAPVGKRTRLIE